MCPTSNTTSRPPSRIAPLLIPPCISRYFALCVCFSVVFLEEYIVQFALYVQVKDKWFIGYGVSRLYVPLN